MLEELYQVEFIVGCNFKQQGHGVIAQAGIRTRDFWFSFILFQL